MSRNNILDELQLMSPIRIESGVAAKLFPIQDSTYGTLYTWGIGDTKPTDDTAGIWAIGAIFQHMDGGDATALYVNEGTIALCDFNAITVGA